MSADPPATATAADRLPRSAPEGDAPSRPTPRRWRPAPIHRVRDLEPRDLRIFVGIVVVLGLLPILSAVVVLTQGWRPSGDNALIGLRARDVLTGHLPLVGQPSTGENFGSGVESNHPGPIEFYVIAPFRAVLGASVGLAVGAAAINAAALVAIGWLSFRRGHLPLLGISAFASLLLVRSLGGNFLHDPLSSNVGALMALALLFACWSIVAGDLRTLPLFVAIGSFTLQDHLSFLGAGAPVVLLAVGVGTWWLARIRRRASDTTWVRPTLAWSVGLAAIVWLPVALDQLFGSHNLTAIFQTFTTGDGEPSGLGFGSGRLAEALAPWPIFMRKVAVLGWLHTPSTVELVTGYLVLVVVVGLGVVAWRRLRTDLTAMVVVVAFAALSGLYTAINLPDGAGVKAANLRWMWTVSAFAWIALAWLAWELMPRFAREVVGVPAAGFGAVATFVLLLSVVSSIELSTDRDGLLAKDITRLTGNVERELARGTYRVTYEGGPVVLSIGPALVHDLEQRGDRVYLDIGPFTRAYGEHREFDDQPIDGTIFVTTEAATAYPEGTKLLARQTVRVNANDEETQTVRVYLQTGEP